MQLIKLFPMRGSPPPDQPGYVRDPGQPYVFRMAWTPCLARQDIVLCKSCPGSVIENHCNHFGKQVDQNVCKTCGGVDTLTKRVPEHQTGNVVLPDRIHEDHFDRVPAELPTLPTSDVGNDESESMSFMP